MKIYHFIYDSIGNPWLNGGGAQRTQALYKVLRKKHDATIICGNFTNARSNIDGVNYYHIGLGNNYILSRITYIIGVWIFALRNKSDIIIEDIGFPFPLMLNLINKKTIASVQFIPNKAFIKKRKFIGKIVLTGYKLGLKRYRNIITVSDFCKKFITTIAPNSYIKIINNGVDSIKRNTNMETEHFLYIGRIDISGKGIDTLIKAVDIAHKQNKNIKLAIVGSGEINELKSMKKLIRAHGADRFIVYKGYLSGVDKYDIIKKSTAFILPSRNETSSIAALEAFSYGKPVIGSNVGGLGEILNNSSASLVSKPNDYAALAKNILNISQNNSLRLTLSRNALDFVNHYTWKNIGDEYEKYLMDIFNK